MPQIWKFELENWDVGDVAVPMPYGADVLHVEALGDKIFVWAMVDDRNHVLDRHFKIVATGQRFSASGLKFIGTVFLASGGAFVCHVFEELGA